MLTFVSIAALGIAVIVFLNFLSQATPEGKTNKGYDRDNPPRLNARRVFEAEPEPDRPRPRICPICGTLLDQTEYLMASIEPERPGRKRQAHIYGCRYCFTTEGVNLEKRPKIKQVDL